MCFIDLFFCFLGVLFCGVGVVFSLFLLFVVFSLFCFQAGGLLKGTMYLPFVGSRYSISLVSSVENVLHVYAWNHAVFSHSYPSFFPTKNFGVNAIWCSVFFMCFCYGSWEKLFLRYFDPLGIYFLSSF